MNTLSPQFTWIPLGAGGGLDESNLSAHLLAPIGSSEFICLDAGTLLSGIKLAIKNGCFDDIRINDDSSLSVEGSILHHHIKAYLITHAYLDHVEGLVVISPNDCQKPIFGLSGIIDDMRNHLFNWRVWPNLCNMGAAPAIGQYSYVTLQEGERLGIEGTTMSVEAFPLAHGGTDSTAFLVESGGEFVLYMGDTGPDEVEKRDTTEALWKRIAPLIKARRLHALCIEASYPDERPDDQLFSHLTPAWVMKSLRQLAGIVDPDNPWGALDGLTVIITHIKPDLLAGISMREVIEGQLNDHNDLGLRLIFAEQGKRYTL